MMETDDNIKGWRTKQLNFYLLVATIASIVIAGTLWIGSIATTNTAQDKRIEMLEARVDKNEDHLFEMNKALSQVSADLQWIRAVIEQTRTRNK